MIKRARLIASIAMLCAVWVPALAGPLPTGEADVVDDAKVADELDMSEMSVRDLIADAQRMLALGGYDPGPIDGRIGIRTQRAIRAYQAAARGDLEDLKGPAAQLIGDEPVN